MKQKYIFGHSRNFLFISYILNVSRKLKKIIKISGLIEKRTLQIEIENNNRINQKIKIKNIFYFVPDIRIGLINPV